jgi:hypothetical protein
LSGWLISLSWWLLRLRLLLRWLHSWSWLICRICGRIVYTKYVSTIIVRINSTLTCRRWVRSSGRVHHYDGPFSKISTGSCQIVSPCPSKLLIVCRLTLDYWRNTRECSLGDRRTAGCAIRDVWVCSEHGWVSPEMLHQLVFVNILLILWGISAHTS